MCIVCAVPCCAAAVLVPYLDSPCMPYCTVPCCTAVLELRPWGAGADRFRSRRRCALLSRDGGRGKVNTRAALHGLCSSWRFKTEEEEAYTHALLVHIHTYHQRASSSPPPSPKGKQTPSAQRAHKKKQTATHPAPHRHPRRRQHVPPPPSGHAPLHGAAADQLRRGRRPGARRCRMGWGMGDGRRASIIGCARYCSRVRRCVGLSQPGPFDPGSMYSILVYSNPSWVQLGLVGLMVFDPSLSIPSPVTTSDASCRGFGIQYRQDRYVPPPPSLANSISPPPLVGHHPHPLEQ